MKTRRGGLEQLARQRNDDIGHLAKALVEMQAKLSEYLENLERTTAAKERIESELRIARDIQMSLLHRIFPPFPDREDVDLHALLEPAKEVGGDLYDFSLLDDDHILFYVGDVSDKGVPAALFMAVTMTLMKRTAQHPGIDPAELLRQVNLDLSSENDNLLFVTLCCFILDLRTGECLYSNAGHNPPLLLRAEGSVCWLELPKGIALGVMPDAVYRTQKLILEPGDMLLLYTDGVTEAMNPALELYSEGRLMEVAAGMGKRMAFQVTERLMASVQEYAAEAPQSDDITMLAIRYKG